MVSSRASVTDLTSTLAVPLDVDHRPFDVRARAVGYVPVSVVHRAEPADHERLVVVVVVPMNMLGGATDLAGTNLQAAAFDLVLDHTDGVPRLRE
jgi:hypothetical protein